MEDIVKIISKVLKVPVESLNNKTSMSDLIEWDSLSHMTIITEIESFYSIHLDGEEIATMTDIKSIKKVLNHHQKKSF